jgi:hypothetical protein
MIGDDVAMGASMNRRFALGLLAAALAAGCGRMAVVTFAPDNQPLAKLMGEAINKKDMKAVENAYKAAERRDASKMPNDEREALKWCYDQCKAGNWDKANAYIQKCLAETR